MYVRFLDTAIILIDQPINKGDPFSSCRGEDNRRRTNIDGSTATDNRRIDEEQRTCVQRTTDDKFTVDVVYLQDLTKIRAMM